jgi:hypothetical protein
VRFAAFANGHQGAGDRKESITSPGFYELVVNRSPSVLKK